jgi:hypothetical protein
LPDNRGLGPAMTKDARAVTNSIHLLRYRPICLGADPDDP